MFELLIDVIACSTVQSGQRCGLDLTFTVTWPSCAKNLRLKCTIIDWEMISYTSLLSCKQRAGHKRR